MLDSNATAATNPASRQSINSRWFHTRLAANTHVEKKLESSLIFL
jgi:hypothetical protein